MEVGGWTAVVCHAEGAGGGGSGAFPREHGAAAGEVERFAVDDADQALNAADIGIPAGHNHFQFEYAAMSFVAPQKVRYRYMLEGFDHNWTDAGARRTAYYTNIPPGHYTFRVQAANNDGVWNTAGATLEFNLQPHFYQTFWFYVLLALAVAGTGAAGAATAAAAGGAGVQRGAGRAQPHCAGDSRHAGAGLRGNLVQLEVLSELLRQKKLEAAAEHLDTTRGFVREGLADARQSIWALRSQDAGETTLPVKLRRVTEQAGGHGLEAALQRVWRVPAAAAGDGERNSARGPGGPP